VTFQDGGQRYYAAPGSYSEFTSAPGNSARYESENAALYIGYSVKQRNKRIEHVEAVEIKNPRTTGT
jgi:hypothetical protein